MDTAKYYSKDDMEDAFEKCREYNIYNAVFIRGFVENHASVFKIEPIRIEEMTKKKIKEINIKRSLDYYDIKGL